MEISGAVTSGLAAVVLGALAAGALFVPVVAISYRRRGGMSLLRGIGWLSFAVYSMALWTYTLLPLPDDGFRCVGAQLSLPAAIGDVFTYDVSSPRALLTNPVVLQLAFNVLLFVPLGFLLRALLDRGIVVATLAGFGISLAIELTQLTGIWGLYPCGYRLFDVGDLATNTIGALLGSVVAAIFVRRSRARLSPDAPRPVTPWRRLLGMLCDVVLVTLGTLVIGLALLLWRTVVLGEPSNVESPAIVDVIATWTPIALQLIVVLATGSTIGERAVLLRPAAPAGGRGALPAVLARPIRFAVGIGGFSALLTVDGGLAGIVLFALVIASFVMVFTTRGSRGLASLVAGTDIADVREGSSIEA